MDTDNRLAMTGAVRRVLTERRDEFDPRQYLTPAREAMTDVCAARMEAFGMVGQAGSVPVVSLDEMAQRYGERQAVGSRR